MKPFTHPRLRLKQPLLLLSAVPLLLLGLTVRFFVLQYAAVLLAVLLVLSLTSLLPVIFRGGAAVEAGAGPYVHHDEADVTVTLQTGAVLPLKSITAELTDIAHQGHEGMPLFFLGKSTEAQTCRVRLHHVGPYAYSVRTIEAEDLFGLFVLRLECDAEASLLALPEAFEVTPLAFAAVDTGMGTMERATEDLGSPSEVRAYAPGDAMKKIHWKLSLRKQELLVRKFEEPIEKRAVILMDCAMPTDENAAYICDALTETAASVFKAEDGTGSEIRMPVYGEHPMQLMARMGLPLVLESLARVDFSAAEDFATMLVMESHHLLRVGSVVIVTSVIDGRIVERISAIRALGPMVRLYLVTGDPENERLLKYIHRLQNALVEVCYVRPLSD